MLVDLKSNGSKLGHDHIKTVTDLVGIWAAGYSQSVMHMIVVWFSGVIVYNSISVKTIHNICFKNIK
jgi:hypothetical protein